MTDETESKSQRRWRRLVVILLVMSIIAVVIGFILPTMPRSY